MPFIPFGIEAYLSRHEQEARHRYSESGVQPLRVGELLELAEASPAAVLETVLDYPQVNGEQALRERIARHYPGATAEHVLVTVGASEANLITAATLVQPGDEVVHLSPTYTQLAGVAANLGARLRPVPLDADDGWRLDTEALAQAVTARCRIVSIVNPNNPTGSLLSPTEVEAVIDAAQGVGAWLLVDEVYAGAEQADGPPTPTLFGRYERTICLGSLSKAYGLPGLRCGWAVADPALLQDLWRRHEYATISAGALANRLAALALSAAVQPRLLARARQLVRAGFETLSGALAEVPEALSIIPPGASAVGFVRCHHESADDFTARLRDEDGILVVPGSCFGDDRHFRFCFGLSPDQLQPGLSGIVAQARSG